MLKKLLLSFIAFLFLVASVGSAQANTILPIPPDGQIPTGSKSHDQYYSVVFDGEGEAAVVAKLNVVNRESTSIGTVNLDIPGKSLRLINAVQEVSGRPCVRYDYSIPTSPICAQYGTSYSSTNYYTLKPEIQKLKKVFSLTINLKRSIEPQGSTSILLHYKVTGYVKSTLGIYNFSLETIKSNFDVDNVRVAVNVQEGFRIRGSSAKTNYAPNFTPLSQEKSLSGGADAGLQAFSSRIVRETGFVKQTQSLDPGENFVVSGIYSSSPLLLYLQDIIKILTIAAIIFLILWVLYRWWRRNNLQAATDIHPLVQVVGISLASSVILIVTAFLGLWFIERLRVTSGSPLGTLSVLLILLLLLVVSVSLIFGPAIYFGIKRDIKYGLLSAGSSIVILLLFTVILLVVLGSFNDNQQVLTPLY